MSESLSNATGVTARETHDLVPARMLNEVVYCPRLFYLEHVLGEWDDSADTVEGKRIHRRVDEETRALPDPSQPMVEGTARSVDVSAPKAGIVARIDLVETSSGAVVPVDYKRGSAPDSARVPGGVWPADRVQIGAQIIALREAGYSCTEGVVYYAASKRRVNLPLDVGLERDVLGAVETARRIMKERVAPPPLVGSPKCPRCSLVAICLPDETNALNPPAATDATLIPPRRLFAPRHDAQAVYVREHGAVIGRDGECLEVRSAGGESHRLRLRQILQLNLFGNVQLTAAAVHALCDRGIPVGLFGFGGWHHGFIGSVADKNVFARIAQFATAADPQRRLELSRAIVFTKIQNERTLLRRNGDPATVEPFLRRLKRLAAFARLVRSEEALLGVEGAAAREYFEAFGLLIAPRGGDALPFTFTERNRRPPRDPINALLSFAYALLVKDARIAVASVGLDPTVGVFHHPRHGRPALALDLMEEFRSLIADSVVLTAVNTEVVKPTDFRRSGGAVALGDSGRKAFIAAYERRMDQEVTHPLFGYSASYRRVLEMQARLLSRTFTGEIGKYPGFRTR